jgi:16S rRNA A1518/A1519 N6-dimethyltransferase RsmA/KsgA/DIM1 with predicted DNA glycosylase/AP lyase activity
MFILAFFLLIFILIILFIFSSPKLSPIPYYPSNKKDLSLIIKTLGLKNNQVIVDLGAGDGLIIFAAAKEALEKKLNTKFIAVEINPILILIMNIRKLFHPNRRNIKIIHGDIFKLNFKKLLTVDFSLLTFYLYISPWFLEKVITNINSQLATNKQQLTIVSYMYPIKSLKEKERIIQGKNKIFVYQI